MRENDPTINDSLMPGEYTPDWIEDIGQGCEMGIVVDDGCFVALTRDPLGFWNPATHIPPRLARRLGELAETGAGTLGG